MGSQNPLSAHSPIRWAFPAATHLPVPDRRRATSRLPFPSSQRRENHGPGSLAPRADQTFALGRDRPDDAHRRRTDAERSGAPARSTAAPWRSPGRSPPGLRRGACGRRRGDAAGGCPRLTRGHPIDPGRCPARGSGPGQERLHRGTGPAGPDSRGLEPERGRTGTGGHVGFRRHHGGTGGLHGLRSLKAAGAAFPTGRTPITLRDQPVASRSVHPSRRHGVRRVLHPFQGSHARQPAALVRAAGSPGRVRRRERLTSLP